MPAGTFDSHASPRWLWRGAALATALFVVLGLATSTGATGSRSDSDVCVTGDTQSAAVELFGSGTEVVETERIAGLTTALVLEPRIYPGTRRRMIAVDGQWCDATAGFNQAWRTSGLPVGDGRAMAEAYATLAAAPYFDGVTLTRVTGAAGVWSLRTHALTNGVVARWAVATDASGIRTATWTATDFAVRPFEAAWEGLTARPGASETYTRLASGVLDDERGLPTAASASAAADDGDPGLLEHTFSDGYTIKVSVGDSHVGVDSGVDTGVWQADVLRATMRAAKQNYEEFLSWGFTKGWRALPGYEQTLGNDVGFIYVNDALSLYCWACVFISDHFQIHMLSEVQVILDALGYDGYRDRAAAYTLIIGHEMFHNFQNRYNKPGHFNSEGRGTPTSYSEGTARFQETLHPYAETSFAPDTLVTAQDANGCNGFDTGGSMDAGMSANPFGKTYNTCFFWGPWYVANGRDAFFRLITEGMPAHSPEANSFLEVARATEQVTGQPIADQLARFAAAAITGRGRTWSTWFGTQTFNWGSLWERWTPTPLAPGGSTTRGLASGGMMAHEIVADSRITVIGSPENVLYILRDNGSRVVAKAVKEQSVSVAAPQPGERIYALVVRPVAGGDAVRLAVGASGRPPRGNETPRPAQAPVSGTVITRAPGAGVIGATVLGVPVNSEFFAFTVPEGVDNARAEFVATYPLPADVDLRLQVRSPESPPVWTTIAAGESGSLSDEKMTSARLPAGTYRIEVYNWAGPPGNPVSIRGTFYNSAGQAGA